MTRTLLRGLAWDVGLPVATYYALHLLGVSDWVALLASTLVAALRVVLVALRQRVLNPFATVMLLVFGIGLALTFVSGDPRFLLVKESFVTGAVGLTFLVTALRGRRPLTLAAQQSWQPLRADELAAEYRDEPDVRRGHRFVSTVWGVGLLTEAAIRVPLVYLLPPSVMVGLSTAMAVLAFGGLAVWTGRYTAAKAHAAHPRPEPETSS
jgi:hypothetical protein